MLYPQQFLLQILSDRLLLVIIGGPKSNLSDEFKLELVTTNNLILGICCESCIS